MSAHARTADMLGTHRLPTDSGTAFARPCGQSSLSVFLYISCDTASRERFLFPSNPRAREFARGASAAEIRYFLSLALCSGTVYDGCGVLDIVGGSNDGVGGFGGCGLRLYLGGNVKDGSCGIARGPGIILPVITMESEAVEGRRARASGLGFSELGKVVRWNLGYWIGRDIII